MHVSCQITSCIQIGPITANTTPCITLNVQNTHCAGLRIRQVPTNQHLSPPMRGTHFHKHSITLQWLPTSAAYNCLCPNTRSCTQLGLSSVIMHSSQLLKNYDYITYETPYSIVPHSLCVVACSRQRVLPRDAHLSQLKGCRSTAISLAPCASSAP